MTKRFKPYQPEQLLLLPPNLQDWVAEDHLVRFISDVVDSLDLDDILRRYREPTGQPPHHPAMMVKVLLYAYCIGMPSSRRIERATWEDVPMRLLSAQAHPDHSTIAEFRKRHLPALARLFVQVLAICKTAGLVKLGHVALDGTKIKANASKHKAMGYERMTDTEQGLVGEVEALLAEAKTVDAAENARYGPGKRGDEIPKDLARRESRLAKIREAKAALEDFAREKAARKAVEQQAKLDAWEQKAEETGKKPGGQPPQVANPAEAVPDPKAQRNFTDPESRIMKDGASKSFEQAYNAQAVVDDTAQIIVATGVTQEANDKRQLVPMLEKLIATGFRPDKVSADAGYFSSEAITDERMAGIDLYVPPDRQKHGQPLPTPADCRPEGFPADSDASVIETMRHRLRTETGKAVYKMRKAIVEPVFGQIKEGRGFRRFSFRGLLPVTQEWDLICLTHNLLKLFRSGANWRTA
ncbi:MAG: IS1182 family transposase [bacterium]|nr:IS1182 family transposase [bacterium]